MEQSVFLVKYRALGKVFAVYVVKGVSRNALVSAREALLRKHPDLVRASVTLVRCSRVGPQVDEVGDE